MELSIIFYTESLISNKLPDIVALTGAAPPLRRAKATTPLTARLKTPAGCASFSSGWDFRRDSTRL